MSKREIDLPDVFREALERVAAVTIADGARLDRPERVRLIRDHEVYLICRHSDTVPGDVGGEPGALRLIQAVVGSLDRYVPRRVIAGGVVTSNWGDAPAGAIAQGTMALLLATLSGFHRHIAAKRRGEWAIDAGRHGGTLEGEPVGLYGFGSIARRFAEMVRPFRCPIHVFDPYLEDAPDYVIREPSLASLFSRCRIVSIHAGLTDETRRSVTAELLSLLPDHGVVINTGRGAIIDQEALFAELASGRLRAGLDVLDDPDTLPADHPARRWENLILTAHQVHLPWPRGDAPPSALTRAQEYAIDNIRRLAEGREILRRVTPTIFDRMT